MPLTKVNGQMLDGAINVASNGNVGVNTTSPGALLSTRNGYVRVQAANQTESNFSQRVGFEWTQETDVQVAKIEVSRPSWGNAPSDMLFFTRRASDGVVTQQMTIDQAGRVTKPNQPGFRAGLQGSTPSIGTGVLWRFDTASGNGRFNAGNNYNTSTYTFTAPIAGRYYFHMQVITEGNANPVARTDLIVLRINGAVVAYSQRRAYYVAGSTGDGGFYVDNATAILELSAGDSVNGANGSPSGATQHANGVYSIFEGYLLG